MHNRVDWVLVWLWIMPHVFIFVDTNTTFVERRLRGKWSDKVVEATKLMKIEELKGMTLDSLKKEEEKEDGTEEDGKKENPMAA